MNAITIIPIIIQKIKRNRVWALPQPFRKHYHSVLKVLSSISFILVSINYQIAHLTPHKIHEKHLTLIRDISSQREINHGLTEVGLALRQGYGELVVHIADQVFAPNRLEVR